MITIKLIGIFIVGFIFVLLGFSICKFYNWKSIKAYLLLLLGLIIMYIPILGPLSKSYQRIEEVQKIETNKVVSIILKLAKEPNKEKIITNKKIISEFCNALRNSEIMDDSFMKNTETKYIIQINMINHLKKTLELKIGEHITCISVNSNGKFHWNYGKLKSRDIENIINE